MKTKLKGFKKKAIHIWASFLWEAMVPQPLCAASSISSLQCAPRISYHLLKAMLSWKRRTLMAFVCEAPTECECSIMFGKQQKPGFLVLFLFLTHWVTLGKLLRLISLAIKQDPPQCWPRGLAVMMEMFCVCTVHYSSPNVLSSPSKGTSLSEEGTL